MPLDPDSVRVDLLKVKRKMYSLYPEGSNERNDFLIISKIQEMGYLAGLFPSEEFQKTEEAYLKEMYVNFGFLGVSVGSYCILGILLLIFGYHKFDNIPWPVLVVYFAGIPMVAYKSIDLIIKSYLKMKPIRAEYQDIQRHISQIMEDLKKLKK